jgi:hypothetical protein
VDGSAGPAKPHSAVQRQAGSGRARSGAGAPGRLPWRRTGHRSAGSKLSPHQIDLREILAVVELRGTLPGETVAIGLQPPGG